MNNLIKKTCIAFMGLLVIQIGELWSIFVISINQLNKLAGFSINSTLFLPLIEGGE